VAFRPGASLLGLELRNTSAVNNGASNDGSLLVGFQNTNRIRGKYDPESVCCATFQVSPGELGMGGYLIAQTEYATGSPYNATAWASA
jgi:hypothetical protein